MVNCKKIQHNYSKYSKAKPHTKRKPNIPTDKYLESREMLWMGTNIDEYLKFFLPKLNKRGCFLTPSQKSPKRKEPKMECCELVTLVSTLACVIAQDKTPDELALIGSIFNQLGDSLSTIAACKGIEK